MTELATAINFGAGGGVAVAVAAAEVVLGSGAVGEAEDLAGEWSWICSGAVHVVGQ